MVLPGATKFVFEGQERRSELPLACFAAVIITFEGEQLVISLKLELRDLQLILS